MTDDTELYGANGGSRDSFDREYLMLMQMAREQGLRLWQDRGVFRLEDDRDDTVFKTEKAGLDALSAIGAFLTEKTTPRAADTTDHRAPPDGTLPRR
jgi:hypothetical protein